MVLEACVIIIDNSEWTRNGDYAPSRLDASKEAANCLAGRKLADNVENCVGIMTMGGANGKCLLSLTSEAGKITTAVGLIQYEEGCNFESSIKIAQIVLKHRQNGNQKQRIIAFLGSPLGPSSTGESMRELGLKMKKNGVSIDIIDFGTENRGNTEILKELIDVVDSEAQPSRLITIESAGGVFLLDSLKSKVPELFNRSSSSNGNSEMMAGGDGFDFDPEMDPELAMALKMSMEEEVNRQRKNSASAAGGEEQVQDSEMNNENELELEDEDDEEVMLARAIALSMEQANNNGGSDKQA